MELTVGDREKGAYLLQHVVKVVAELSRDGDYGGFFSDGALDKPLNFLVVADSSLLVFENDVDLVLDNDNVLELRDDECD